MKELAVVLLFVICFKGSNANAPDDPELMERSLAAANMQGFSRQLLLDAILPDFDGSISQISKEELFKMIGSADGQEAARAAAMRSMLTRSRARGADGWLGGMCDAMPWLSWLMRCASSDDEPGVENREEPAPSEPNTLIIMDYEWATCEQEGDYEEEENNLVI